MKIVIQRVKSAEVMVSGSIIGQIRQGLLLFVGVAGYDTPGTVKEAARKILNLRIFEDDKGKMNKSIKDIGGGLLVISQFTLLANTDKGHRPSFNHAAAPPKATELYRALKNELKKSGLPVESGRFGEKMQVSLTNDGPVTIAIDLS